MKTSLMSLFGFSQVALTSSDKDELVSAIGSPPGGVENLEISLMLDVTGSMCDNNIGPCSTGSKISALKDAASNLVDKLLPVSSDEYSVKFSIVPFSTRVRLAADGSGGAIMKAVTNLNPTWTGYFDRCEEASGTTGSEGAGDWTCTKNVVELVNNWKLMPCVTDRFANGLFGLTDAAPANGTWSLAHGGSRAPFYDDSRDIPLTSQTGTSAADATANWNYDPNGICSDTTNGNIVVPLTDNESKLQSSINGLSAFGATAGVLGTTYSWYTLSPNWGAIWGGDSAPRPYSELNQTGSSGAKKLRKIAVLMTDGGYNTLRGQKGTGEYSWLNSSAKILCGNMKSAGVEVYTIGFALGTLSSTEAGYARDTLSNCASGTDHFSDAESSEELIKAFDDIGSSLTVSGIRLIK